MADIECRNEIQCPIVEWNSNKYRALTYISSYLYLNLIFEIDADNIE